MLMAGDIPGPKPVLENEELLKKIKQCIIDGKNLEETANICEINRDSFYCWHSDNYLKIADKIEGWKRDRKVMLASRNVDEILQMPKEKESLKVVADMSKFVLEVLDKDFKPKADLTLNPVLVKFLNDKPTEDNRNT